MTKDRGLQASYIIGGDGKILGIHQAGLPQGPQAAKRQRPGPGARRFDCGRCGARDRHVTALIQLQALNDAYLEVVRVVDPQVLGYYRACQPGRCRNITASTRTGSEVQLVFAALYAVVALVILLAAIWSGLWAANRLVRPISGLIGAAERVSEGDLTAQVKVDRDDDEIGMLGLAFNRMTGQLGAQRNDLIAANRQIDERRRFTETVLSGVSAGVIGVDQ